MDSFCLMYDFEGTYIGVNMGNFNDWFLSRCSSYCARQMLAQFIVEQSINESQKYHIIASDSSHCFNIPDGMKSVILCDFSSCDNEYLHLDNWSFYVCDSNIISGFIPAEQLLSCDIKKFDFYTLSELS